MLNFSREAVEYEETRNPYTTRAWHLTTADGIPMALVFVEGGPWPPMYNISIGVDASIRCEIPLELFQEFSTCMTLPMQEWARREG